MQVKNRESAARSRARKQEYTAQLEVQVAKLRQENRLLLEKVSSHRQVKRMRWETLAADCNMYNLTFAPGLGLMHTLDML